jgi:hypothetical protein
MTRTGKIARLPAKIREELNGRLENGEDGKTLIKWLNAQPETAAILDKYYENPKVTDSNLSEWKRGGYEDWKRNRDVTAAVSKLIGCPEDMVEKVQGTMIDQMAVMLAAHMLVEIKSLPLLEDDETKIKKWREIRITLAALRRYQFFSRKLKLFEDKAAKEIEEDEESRRPLTSEEKEERVKRILGIGGLSWDNFQKKWVGPGAEERIEEEEAKRRVAAQMIEWRKKRAELVKANPELAGKAVPL